MDQARPQLVMLREPLDDLPALALPGGYSARHYRIGDGPAWDAVIAAAFGPNPGRTFLKVLRLDPAFRPQRVWFLCDRTEPIATASAWYRPGWGAERGMVHYVAVHPDHAGRGLGTQVNLAALHQMRREGRTAAVLQTDDFRLPAIATYLKLGFRPVLVHENQRQRWPEIFANLNKPELAERFADVLAGPVQDLPRTAPADMPETYRPSLRCHPRRTPQVGQGTVPLDFLGDESLYRPSEWGTASVRPVSAQAGSAVDEPLVLTYTAGPGGLPTGAAVAFLCPGQNPLGFCWQTTAPDAAGFCRLQGPDSVDLQPTDQGFAIAAGSLDPGESVTITLQRTLGRHWHHLAGPRSFRVVISPGPDEPQRRLPEPLVVDIQPGKPERLEVLLPSTRRPGEPVDVTVTARDANDNRVPTAAPVCLHDGERPVSAWMARGLAQTRITPRTGTVRIEASIDQTHLHGQSNPSDERAGLQFFLGDLHCHNLLSAAEGWCEELYRFAIEDRRLDFLSVSEQCHGHLDNEKWTLMKYFNERFHREGSFVSLLGFEWQHAAFGDKIVHCLGGDQPYLPADDPRTDTPAGLYEALRGCDALVISHHPGYHRPAWVPGTDYSAVETDVERLVELWSMHGSSEGHDPTDRPLVKPDPDNTVYAALRDGLRVGFVAGSDTHSGRPGGSAREPRPYWGGLVGLWAENLTRRGVFAALHARRTVALTGARILLEMTVNGSPMGSELPPAEQAEIELNVLAPGRIDTVEVLKNTRVIETHHPGKQTFAHGLCDATEGPAFYHVRVRQTDGHLAVCSPVWVGEGTLAGLSA